MMTPTYFWYRWIYTIEWDVPYRLYYQSTICVAEMFGSICVMMLAVIRFPQPWAYNQQPPAVEVGPKLPRYNVHVLVPCYNEPSDIVLATCEAALALTHPWAKVMVYLLDDGRNLQREKTVINMGNERLIYVARPKYPGLPVHGKAGNLNHTLKFVIFAQRVPRENDVVVVFDADMKAHPNFLHHTLPYLEEDPRTALVQTPQHFFNVDHTGDIFNHQNCTFFFGVQTGLDAWRATVCCGTNFCVRASALAAVGWFPTESITEDFLLSLKVTASGWHCRYHGHVLVTGEAPEDLRQIFKQRSRWCTGCFQVFFQVETFMWVRQLPSIQMLCYFNSIMGYLSTIICFPVFFVVRSASSVSATATSTTALWTSALGDSVEDLPLSECPPPSPSPPHPTRPSAPDVVSLPPLGSDRVGLHEDPSRQGAHHTAHAPLGRLLRLDGGGHRDDATQLQPLLRLPRLQGQLHHVVVLPQGDVEGGAWPPRAA